MRILRVALPMLLGAAGCAGLPGGTSTPHPELDPFLGVYQGGFDSARTATPDDDLNHNPCPSADQRCDVHQAPLDGILLSLERGDEGLPAIAFYWTSQDLEQGRPLDLLGRGCGTRIGPLTGFEERSTDGAGYLVATFALEADNRLCLGKLRPVSRHQLRLELHARPAGAARVARVVIDRNVRDDNYLYVVEDGERRRVRIDLANTIEENHQRRYRVCIEDDAGEYTRCVLTDRELRSFALPVPLPGGAAISYTWWQELRPRLQRTHGRYVVEQYVGVFEPTGAEARSP